MSFFGKQSSKDFLFKKSSELRSSFTEGSSRLFGSVIDKKTSLVDGISSKFDKVVKLTSASEPVEGAVAQDETKQPAAGYNGAAGASTETTQDSATTELSQQSYDDWRLYQQQQTTSVTNAAGTQNTIDLANELLLQGDSFTKDSFQNTGRRRTNPFLNEDLADVNPFATDVTVTTDGSSVGGVTGFSSSTNPFSVGDAMDYLGSANRLSANRGDPFAITPTSEQALPKPALEPKRIHRESTEGGDESGGDSESTEGCDENPEDPSDDFGDEDVGASNEFGASEARAWDGSENNSGGIAQSGSHGSDLSWSSSINEEAPMDDLSRQSMEFMRGFVAKVFDNRSFITQDDKATYGQLIRCSVGRLWFARYVNAQANHSKRVDEQNFFRLVQFLAVALFECNEEEDFAPARKLMNMCFIFFLEVPQPSGPAYKHFLYSYLKDQPIWRSLRFWNAAFFDSVQAERARRPTSSSQDAIQKIREERETEEKIVFGQLEIFTCNMRSLGLDKNLCLDFLRKQSGIVSLREEQLQMLKEHIENWDDQQSRAK